VCICRNNDFKADIIISDHFSGGEIICERIKESGKIFSEVYYAKTKKYYDSNYNSKINKIKSLLTKKIIEETIQLNNNYDFYFCANADPFSVLLYNYLKKFNNRKLKACWFEDGLGTYSFDKVYFERKNISLKYSLFKKIFGIKILTDEIYNFFVFRPECMDWKPNAAIIKIPAIDKNDKEIINSLNAFWGYNNCKDNYNKKMIFFEDGFGDWDSNIDVEIVKNFSEKVGKDNIIVKIHPRNSRNRFKELGFTTNVTLSIPWEVIALNTNVENTLLLTMYSQSVIMPFLLMGVKSKAVILAKTDPDFEKTDHMYFDYLDKYYYSKYSEIFYVPNTMEELNEYINTLNVKGEM